MLGIGLGLAPMPVTYTLGVFTPALIAAFGWTRAEILFVTVPMLLGILPASFAAGWLADRHGVRRLVMGSQLLFGACFVVLGLFVGGRAPG
jgi:MFS family permease